MSSYKEALEVAKEYDLKLSIYNFDPGSLVFVFHVEGTQLVYRSAFIRFYKDFVLIFTEHHGYHVYCKEDLITYSQFKRVDIEKFRGSGKFDKCEDCEKEFLVEDLYYGKCPKTSLYSVILCDLCYLYRSSDYGDLWKELNEEKDWGFIWGSDKIEDLKKAVVTTLGENDVESWLNTKNPVFSFDGNLYSPLKAFENGYHEEIWQHLIVATR